MAFAASAALSVPAMAQTQSGLAAQKAWEESQYFRAHPYDVPTDPVPAATITPQSLVGLARPYGGTPISVTSFHYDNYRTGWNPNETDLTPAQLKAKNFGLLTTLQVDGTVFAQPTLVTGYTMPDSTVHDVLIIATAHNSVYAYDAQTYALLWQVNLGPSQNAGDIACVDVTPEYGIATTPAIVPGPNPRQQVIYLVAGLEPTPGTYSWVLHGLDLGTGADVATPITVTGTEVLSNTKTVTFDPKRQWPRMGLAYANNSIYVGVGSHCDIASLTSGWLFRYDTSLNLKSAFPTIQKQTTGLLLGGVWMSGSAPAIDANGNVFVTTGNGAVQLNAPQPADWSQSVLKLSPDLKTVLDSFTVGNYAQLNQHNFDLGSGGVILIPPVAGQAAPPMAVTMGKDPIIYLLNQNNLGGYSSTNTGALQALTVGLTPSGRGLFGGPSYYNGPNGPTIYYQTTGDFIRAYALTAGAAPTLTATVAGTDHGAGSGSFSVVSSNGSGAAAGDTGIVWVVRRSSPLALMAYDALTLGAPIYRATAGVWPTTNYGRFVTPMVANGRVYVGSQQEVTVFGLLK